MINWQRVCLNLRRHYRPLSSDWRHLNRLARGEVDQPRFLTGVRLLDLHADIMGDRHREALR